MKSSRVSRASLDTELGALHPLEKSPRGGRQLGGDESRDSLPRRMHRRSSVKLNMILRVIVGTRWKLILDRYAARNRQ